MELTILMPCLNEAATLRHCIDQAKKFLDRSGINGEVVISDNGSTDGSQTLALAAGARVVHAKERGYGAALREGIRYANGRYVIMGDCDQSYDFSKLELFVRALRAGNQLVVGNRFDGGIEPGAMPPLHRYLGNPVLSGIGRLFFRSSIRDFHCGLRGFDRSSLLGLGLNSPGMEYASEMIVKATLKGYRIAEVPTSLHPDGRGRPPHLRSWRDGWRHLRFLLLFCPRWLFLYPGSLLALFGLTGLFLLRTNGMSFDSVGFGVHSLLYSAASLIVGAQLIQLALITRWMAVLSGVASEPPWLTAIRPYVSLERGLAVGAVLFIAGVGWTLSLVFDWQGQQFGALDPAEVMHAAIPAATLMILGAQATAATLFGAALNFWWKSILRTDSVPT
ncbi:MULTISPECIES: glycosyltransferase family 2 protein [unclassified Variovorax]|uniref:glycosyltransferase family 2 protein n=1 Tax=unclassified Variovorax TaxID=663243 RepID=UPI00076D7303|nr:MULTISPECIES: glycosyltransferase family 2 protein [unclassified Variovorax]KWT85751.1 dolichol-p-glucose synthetase, (glycosyltransferase) [Variovorax sp. WDL1]PNG58379.1 putative glycosyltransferase [Variovorax sp. B4]PNG61831.1 putative glycosyltransferase [Variovorax sp. B2]VTV12106.1 Glucosyl-3-phosphoglycerate synthase [Variovorax sp. WDL1]